MDKICFVTYYHSNNYGSRLQATALSETLRNMGYDTYFLKEFKARLFTVRHARLTYARVYNKLHKREKKKFFSPVPYEISPRRKERLDAYSKEFFQELNVLSDKEWNKIVSEGMIFVAGSDIIWQPANGYPAKFFLDFAVYAGLPCFSYASSLGAVSLPKKYFHAYRRYLGAYRGIGVRETKTVRMLETIVKKPVTKVVDPTLLLTKEEWDAFADRAKYGEMPKPGQRYIFCYFVMHDERYWEYVRKVAEETGLEIVILPMHDLDEQQPYTIIKDGTPYEFIDLIRDAEFVLTDSFHTCVFSILYQKEFYLMRRARKAEDTKYDDLLGRYHLKDRVISDEESFVRKPEIDYDYVCKRLMADREDSFTYLEKTLEKCAD